MARGLWSGNISFGLVNIPVSLQSFETHDKVHFHMLDKKDMSPIKYRTVNGSTQKEVARSQIVKGYEYKKGNFVLVTPDDFKQANVKATKTIDIEAFVEATEVSAEFFERPYLIEPSGKIVKSYALLREALRKSNKIGIAKIVMSGKQHLCALMVRNEYLVLEILRYEHELAIPNKKSVPSTNLKSIGVKDSEIKMAEQLIAQMTEKFKPGQYKDTYQTDLMKFINSKIKRGSHVKAKVIETNDSDSEKSAKVLDFMSLLKKSVDRAGNSHSKSRNKEA